MKTASPPSPGNPPLPRCFGIGTLVTLAIMVFLASGCGNKSADPAQVRADETALIRDTVEDPVRVERLLAILDERDRLQQESEKLVQRYEQSLRAVNASYSATDEQLLDLMRAFDRERRQFQHDFVDQVTAMKDATTAAEWQVIARFQLKKFQPHQSIYQHRQEPL